MIVLVTGCRSGFGLLTAVHAARRGHTVYAGVRDVDTADDLRAAAAGLPVHVVALEVTDADQRTAVVDRIVAEHGRLDALVNNAGVALGGPLEQIREDELRRCYDVNVFGAWALTKAVLPVMRQQRSGVIVNMSSVGGVFPVPGLGAYNSSKFALEGMTDAWRHEVARFGIRMHLVQPGPYRTDIWGRNRRVTDAALAPDSPYAFVVRWFEKLEPGLIRRAGDPQEVADYVVRLLEEPSSPFRTALGPDSWVRPALKRYAPDRLLAAVIQGMLRRA